MKEFALIVCYSLVDVYAVWSLWIGQGLADGQGLETGGDAVVVATGKKNPRAFFVIIVIRVLGAWSWSGEFWLPRQPLCVCVCVCVEVLVVDASLCYRRIQNVGILLGGLCFAPSGSSLGDPEVAWGRILGRQLRVVVRLGLIEITELGLGIGELDSGSQLWRSRESLLSDRNRWRGVLRSIGN